MTAEIIPLVPPKIHCSFCKTQLSTGLRYFSGPQGTKICFHCVALAKERCQEAS